MCQTKLALDTKIHWCSSPIAGPPFNRFCICRLNQPWILNIVHGWISKWGMCGSGGPTVVLQQHLKKRNAAWRSMNNMYRATPSLPAMQIIHFTVLGKVFGFLISLYSLPLFLSLSSSPHCPLPFFSFSLSSHPTSCYSQPFLLCFSFQISIWKLHTEVHVNTNYKL